MFTYEIEYSEVENFKTELEVHNYASNKINFLGITKYERAIEMEDFEEAVKLRDQIKNLGTNQEEIEKLREHPELLSFFNSYKWLDMLIGNIPYYHITDLPNARIVWNTDSNVWNVVATTEILSGKTITLPIKK